MREKECVMEESRLINVIPIVRDASNDNDAFIVTLRGLIESNDNKDVAGYFKLLSCSTRYKVIQNQHNI